MTMQRRNEPWNCQWCEAPDTGFTTRNGPAAAVSDLSADMARPGLAFVSRAPRQPEARDTQPVLIVTTSEVPGYRITQVHGDVFGLIVRARNYFSNLGAQFRTLAGGESPDTPRCWPTAATRPANGCGAKHGREEPTRSSPCALTAARSAASCPEIAAYGTAVTVETIQTAGNG